MTEKSLNSVRAVQRALRLLTLLRPDRQSASLMEFAQASGLATSTVQRLLQTLEHEHFLKRQPDGRYTFGIALVQLGLAALQSMELYDHAKPYLERLSEQTGETANLAVLDELSRALYIRQALSRQVIRHANWLGRPFPTAGTAVGAALTGKVDGKGYFATRHTQEPDVTAVAAPVYGPEGTIIAGLSVTGPSYRIADDDLARFAGCVTTTAQELTLSLGGRWPYQKAESTENSRS